MEEAAVENVALADLVRAKELGLDANRLLFIRYLLVTKRLSDEVSAAEPDPLAA